MHFTSGCESLVWYGFLVFNRTPMLTDASSLANTAYLIGDALRAEYDIDPTPIYEELGLDPDGPGSAGARISNKVLNQLWVYVGAVVAILDRYPDQVEVAT